MVCVLVNLVGFFDVQLLPGRNKEIGVEWGFQLKCQKNNKFAKVQSNNWESENYNRLANTVADDDDQELFEDFETDQGGRIRR